MFAKVFRSLFYGSLAGQSAPQLVLVCLLTHADRDGNVELPAPAIAALTGLPLEAVKEAIVLLESPDEFSRSEESEGRRLESFGPARWKIVNHGKYRATRDDEQRREQTRAAKARYDAKHRISRGKPTVSHGKPQEAHAEADTESRSQKSEALEPTPLAAGGDREAPAKGGDKANGQSDARREWDEGFHEGFWPEYPRKVKKQDALKAWRSMHPWTQDHLNTICQGLESWVGFWKERGTAMEHIPYPASFLRAGQHDGEPQ